MWPYALALLGAVACRNRVDPINQEIRNITSADGPPAYLEGVRWKLLRQIYEDRQYRPLLGRNSSAAGENQGVDRKPV